MFIQLCQHNGTHIYYYRRHRYRAPNEIEAYCWYTRISRANEPYDWQTWRLGGEMRGLANTISWILCHPSDEQAGVGVSAYLSGIRYAVARLWIISSERIEGNYKRFCFKRFRYNWWIFRLDLVPNQYMVFTPW